MKLTILQGEMIPFDETDVLKRLGMPPEHRFAATIRDLLERTKNIAEPKALFMECTVEKVTEEIAVVDGVPLCSELLASRLRNVPKVYPYLCTCGLELDAYGETLTDMSEKFAFDAIMDFYQKQMEFIVKGRVVNLLPEGYVVGISNPGSLSGWTIHEQKKLFALYGDAAAEIGVSLKPHFLMTPLKTTSGICYQMKELSTDCVYCQREDCPRRKEPYCEKALLETLYRK